MKTTACIYDIIRHRMKIEGYDELTDKKGNHFVIFDDEQSFMRKIQRLDEHVKPHVDRLFFLGETLTTDVGDKAFKSMWLNTFLHREIAFQTVDLFASKTVGVFRVYEDFLNTYYSELMDYVNGLSESQSTEAGGQDTKHRRLMATLPQDVALMNVGDDRFEYPDENTAWNERQDKDNKSETQSTQKTLDELLKMRDALPEIIHAFDKQTFLQVW